jgi:hypothetical protein
MISWNLSACLRANVGFGLDEFCRRRASPFESGSAVVSGLFGDCGLVWLTNVWVQPIQMMDVACGVCGAFDWLRREQIEGGCVSG